MTLYETTVPGVGRKFELKTPAGVLVVIVHDTGKRDVYHRTDDTTQHLFSVRGQVARQLGGILSGTYYQPTHVDETEIPLGDAFLEWSEIPVSSSLADVRLRDANVWRETGVTVLAVQRGTNTHASPNPTFRLQAGDVVVTLGTREEQAAFGRIVDGDETI